MHEVQQGARSRTFEQTLNPFNKNAGGHPKTRVQIHEELVREAKQWENEPFMHARCEP